MIRQLKADGFESYRDFNLYISKKTVSLPKRKSIKETIPFSNNTYDFSKIDGEVYYEERELTIVFDIAETSPIQLEKSKRKIVNWLMNIQDSDIFIDYVYGYHFHGSYDDNSWTEDFDYGELTIKFKVYPYLISDDFIKHEFVLKEGINDIELMNESSHMISPIIIVNSNVEIHYNNYVYLLESGIFQDQEIQTDDEFKLFIGLNHIKIKADSECLIIFKYREEVL